MVCCADNCLASIPGDTRVDAATKATEAGWRHWWDGKVPGLAVGVAICPVHVGEAHKHTGESS